MPVAQKTVEIDVPPSKLMAVICDFAQYPRFVPDMVEATILRAEPTRWTVKFAVRIIRRVEYTLMLERQGPPVSPELRLSWSLVEGAFKSNTGGWVLEPLDGGARTRATYTLDLDIGMFVPGSVLKTLLEHNLPATLDAFKARAEAL